jgi:hypothetical protein
MYFVGKISPNNEINFSYALVSFLLCTCVFFLFPHGFISFLQNKKRKHKFPLTPPSSPLSKANVAWTFTYIQYSYNVRNKSKIMTINVNLNA